jgi:hypothetical protein
MTPALRDLGTHADSAEDSAEDGDVSGSNDGMIVTGPEIGDGQRPSWRQRKQRHCRVQRPRDIYDSS